MPKPEGRPEGKPQGEAKADAATTELDGGRLNLDVDARNRVTDVRCG